MHVLLDSSSVFSVLLGAGSASRRFRALDCGLSAVKTEAASNPQHLSVRRLKDFSNEWFMFGQRQADGAVEWHETQADIFIVQSGSATLLVGGTLVGGQITEPHEQRGGTIRGGVRVKLSPGDIVRIPAKVPHQVLLEGAPEFTFFIIKVKGY